MWNNYHTFVKNHLNQNIMNENLKLVENFIKHFESLENNLTVVTKELSEIDKKISDWYHRVEGTDIKHVSESHRLLKEIKPLLGRRRNVKIESAILRSTCDSLRSNIIKLKESHKTQMTKHNEVLQEIKDRAK